GPCPCPGPPLDGPAGRPRPRPRRLRRVRRRAHDPRRPGLDAQHQPHRPVRRAGAGLVRRGRAGRGVPALQLDLAGHARLRRRRGVRRLLPGHLHLLQGRGRRHHLGDGRAAALGQRDRGAGRPRRHHQPRRPRRRGLRRVRRPGRGAQDAGGDPGRGRPGRVLHRRAGHVGLRGALRRRGRLHRAVRGVGGHRGRAAGRAAEDLPLQRLRLPRGLRRAARRQLAVARRAPRAGARVRAGGAARLHPRRRRPRPGGADPARRPPRRPHRARAGGPQPADAGRALPARRRRRRRAADGPAVGGLLGVRVRQRHPGRPGRRAAAGAPGLHHLVDQRLPGGDPV
ncbi:MAG: Hydroxymethylpyrimidine ABC transporter, substrate-binding component, partial [uncultured Pseudonocardia sp.]